MVRGMAMIQFHVSCGAYAMHSLSIVMQLRMPILYIPRPALLMFWVLQGMCRGLTLRKEHCS